MTESTKRSRVGSMLGATDAGAIKKAGKRLGMADLPNAYSALCEVYLPRPIRDKSSFKKAFKIIVAMAGFEEQFNQDQGDYFALVTDLILAYQNELERDQTERAPLRVRLQHLLESTGWTASDFSAFLGVDAETANKILVRDQNLTLNNVRRLSRHFSLHAEYFL